LFTNRVPPSSAYRSSKNCRKVASTHASFPAAVSAGNPPAAAMTGLGMHTGYCVTVAQNGMSAATVSMGTHTPESWPCSTQPCDTRHSPNHAINTERGIPQRSGCKCALPGTSV
jgi:hypothetical protein